MRSILSAAGTQSAAFFPDPAQVGVVPVAFALVADRAQGLQVVQAVGSTTGARQNMVNLQNHLILAAPPAGNTFPSIPLKNLPAQRR